MIRDFYSKLRPTLILLVFVSFLLTVTLKSSPSPACLQEEVLACLTTIAEASIQQPPYSFHHPRITHPSFIRMVWMELLKWCFQQR
jgi:hypothetical protein